MKKKRAAFEEKLYHIFVVSVLLPFCIVLLAFGLYSVMVLIKWEENSTQNVLNTVSQSLEQQFAENEQIRSMFYIYDELFRGARKFNNAQLYAYYGEYSNIQMENAYTKVLTKAIYLSQQDIRAVVFFPTLGEGDVAYCLEKSRAKLNEIVYPDYKKTSWYQDAVSEVGKAVYLAPHMPEYTSNKKLGEVYSYISAILDSDTNKAIGVVKIDIAADEIYEKMNMLKDVGKGGLFLLKDGQIFAKSRSLAGEMEILGDRKVLVDGSKYRFECQEIPQTGLEIAYINSADFFFRRYLYITLLFIAFGLLGVGMGFANYRSQAKKMVEEFKKITLAAQQVEKGNLDVEIDIHESSEFGRIAKVINHMIRELKKYIDKEYVLTIQQQKAQYQALQAQINPHFLYNTLNGFVALNRMGEKKLLEKSINDFSRLFRYVCSNREYTEVKNELNFLEKYLELEKLKYGERLEYLIWMDEVCRNIKIPKLLLQPAVENSILHGMGDTEKPILIQIAACSKEVKGIGLVMVIVVKDNGVGFDKKKINDSGDNIGMENVRMRMELCRSHTIYHCRTEVGKGTETTFVFPGTEES